MRRLPRRAAQPVEVRERQEWLSCGNGSVRIPSNRFQLRPPWL